MLTLLHCTDKLAESQRESLQLREMITKAQCTFSSSLGDQSFGAVSGEDIDEDGDRLESVKVAALSSVVRALATLPFLCMKFRVCPNYFPAHRLFS